MKKALLTLLFLFSLSTPSSADVLKLPRFASLKSDKINLRTGPGERFPIDWVYKRQGLPVEIIDEFEHWRKIQDKDGTKGWVHKKMLSGQRTALTTKEKRHTLYKKEKPGAAIVAYLDGEVLLRIIKCQASSLYCKVKLQNITGYINRNELFGIYPNEEVEE